MNKQTKLGLLLTAPGFVYLAYEFYTMPIQEKITMLTLAWSFGFMVITSIGMMLLLAGLIKPK